MIFIGTSGWSYPSFIGPLYKNKMTSLDQLKFYASKFNTVEINYSFYHIPKAQSFKNWDAATPENFVFAIKLNRQFTHDAKLVLNEDAIINLETFLLNASELGKKFGVLLVQTPKSLKFDIERLEKFLNAILEISKHLKYPPRLAFEFRNEDWFNQETYDVLKKYNAAIVISQSSAHPEKHIVTSNLLYIRFHGPEQIFNSAYSNESLKDWSKFIKEQNVKDNFIYFNNTMQGQAIDNAVYLQKLF